MGIDSPEDGVYMCPNVFTADERHLPSMMEKYMEMWISQRKAMSDVASQCGDLVGVNG